MFILNQGDKIAGRTPTKRDAWSKKKWYSVVSPKFLGSKTITETPSLKEKMLIGRTVTVSLSDLTGNIKHFQTKVKLKINKVDKDTAYTEYVEQEIVRDKIARIVRKWSSRIDNVQTLETKDNKKIKIKSLMTSIRRTNTSIKDLIRKEAASTIEEWCKDKTLEEIVNDVNSMGLQRQISANIKKIYPIRTAEIRKIEVL